MNIYKKLREFYYKNIPYFKRSSRIFGIGLSKTGTSSLSWALKTLGFKVADYPRLPTLYQRIVRCEALTDEPLYGSFNFDWKKNARILGVEEKIKFQFINAESLPFPDESFDGIFMYDTLQHVGNKNRALNECIRVMKLEGLTVIIEWNEKAIDDDYKKYGFKIDFIDPRKYLKRMRTLNKLAKKYSVLSVDNIWGENISKIYNISKIGFNKSLSGDLNMRVFEVMSCGTMLLTDRIENGITDIFEDKKHLVMYENEEELYELIEYYLINEDEREEIAKKGQSEVHKNHKYDNRVQYMLNKIKL